MANRTSRKSVEKTRLEKADLAAAEAARPVSRTRGARWLGGFSDLSDQEPLYAANLTVILTGLVLREQRLVRVGTRMLAAHLLATAVRGAVKRLVDRTRPDAAVKKGRYELSPGRRYERDYNSFPSGHTAGAVAVARALTRDYPSASIAASAASAGTGAAQVVRGAHFPTDVIVGAGIALASEKAIDSLIRAAKRY